MGATSLSILILKKVLLREWCGTGGVEFHERPLVTQVALGDLVEIFPGEVAPVDGELVGWTEGSDAAPVGAWSTAAVVAFDECLRFTDRG